MVGDEIVRHRLASRVIHWAAGVLFLVCVLTGMPIWTPVFGWMAGLLGGLAVCRVLHPWAGLLFLAAMRAMFLNWWKDMRLDLPGQGVVRTEGLAYLTLQGHDDEVGKYNGGQKLFFFAASLGSLGVLASGLVLWFPSQLPPVLREAGILLHDLTFILFAVAIVLHIYLARGPTWHLPLDDAGHGERRPGRASTTPAGTAKSRQGVHHGP